MSMTTTNPGGKSFWALTNTAPESIAGKALLLAGGTAAAYYVVPVLTSIAWSLASLIGAALTITVGATALFALGAIIIDGRLVKLLDYGYRLVVRGLLGFFITLDPIGIMKNYLQDVNKTIATFAEKISDLRKAINKAREDRNTFQQEYEEAMSMVSAAKKLNPADPVINTESNKANRRHRSIQELDKLIAQMEAILGILERYFAKSKAYRDDLKDTIDFEARRRAAMKSAASAFSAARRILSGNDVGAEFYDAALEATQQQVAGMIGEMQQWVFESQDILKTFELQEAAAVERALKRLEEQEHGSKVLEYKPGDAVTIVEQSTANPVERRSVSADVESFLRPPN